MRHTKYENLHFTPNNLLTGQTALIFTSTCAHAQKATLMLRNLGFQAICLHGQMAQPKRIGALTQVWVYMVS